MKELNKNKAGTVESRQSFKCFHRGILGKLVEGLQIESNLEPMPKGNVKDYVNIPPKLALLSTASGTSIVKLQQVLVQPSL